MARVLTRSVVLLALLAAPVAAQDLKTYRSRVYGFEFDYAARYVLEETTTPDGVPIFLVLREAGATRKDWWIEVSPHRLDAAERRLYGAEATATPLAFARHQAMLMCTADGPGSSVYCPQITRRTPFVSRGGVPGEVLYLREIHEQAVEDEDRSEVTERTRGPIYALDITGPGGARVLIFTLTTGDDLLPRPARPLEQMARSVRRVGVPGVQ